MTTVLEAFATIPVLIPDHVVNKSFERGPRVKSNPDGTLCHVRTAYVQSNRVWLVIITYIPHESFRCRVWLRRTDGTLLDIEDKDGFKTRRGAEWCAYMALLHIFRDVASVRRLPTP